MSTTRELLLSRRNELAEVLPAMAEEWQALRTALIAMQGRLNALQKELATIDEALKKLEPEETQGPITIMQAVMEVLNHKTNGMTAIEILDEINAAYFNGTIVRTSLSPQLSRLKNRDKKIELRGNRWYALPKEPTLFNRRV
jgi:predicted nuclease with TOPRIM domain